jgi:molybdopterin molybdotransferase
VAQPRHASPVPLSPAPHFLPSQSLRLRRTGVPWPVARAEATTCATALTPRRLPLQQALGQILVEPLRALTDLPASDVSAMDGWAVAGSPPWRVVGDVPAHLVHGSRLANGSCVRIATGAAVPAGTTCVVPVEYSRTDAETVHPLPQPRPRSHVRPAGQEARAGELLLEPGRPVTPTVIGLAAAAGHDELLVSARATVDTLVLGDELGRCGASRPGQTRDALGPQLPGWLVALGGRPTEPRHLADRRELLVAVLDHSGADVIVTTGGTSVGPRDYVRSAMTEVGGRAVVDAVGVKPGHPMLLAALPRGRWLVALPGNPFAACAALMTLAAPLLGALHGRRPQEVMQATIASDERARPGDRHRLVPAILDATRTARVLPSCGAAMLRGLARADGLLVIGPDGAVRGDSVGYLPLPWSAQPDEPPARPITVRG